MPASAECMALSYFRMKDKLLPERYAAGKILMAYVGVPVGCMGAGTILGGGTGQQIFVIMLSPWPRYMVGE